MSATTHHGYEPFNMKDPFPAYAELRREEPVMFDERIGYYVVSRYDDVKATFEDWESFSSENAQAPVRPMGAPAKKIMEEGGFTAYSGLSARVPPEHTRLRTVASKAFTPRRYKVLEPAIRENVDIMIDKMLAAGEPGDILSDIANDLPTITILTLFGVPISRIPEIKKWSASRALMTWAELTDEEQIPHAHNLVEYWNFCQEVVASNKANPGQDNLAADLLKLQAEGNDISDHEIASLLYSMLFAGHETTTTLISNSLRMLLSNPETYQALVEDPEKIPGAIDEVLRMAGSIVAWRRKATRDAEIAGVKIPEGSGVLLLMGSANRDASVFENPDVFDIGRENARNHMSFGYGIHFCLGNLLAKLQGKVALEEITKKIPTLRLMPGADINFIENLSFRVPTSVPVEWTK
ncbi:MULTISPECIES: cytochrome P450 [Aurantimicrobium]|uniref:Cytochrome P450 116 n=1 Tax=Aurantimicrobium photophilum TaxID=1987356 RepID=A0A2Z3S4Z9_9MICO|nr:MULTISPECIES: cytochrome P450 [Aurantimicrobium]AWR21898.1 Cytochrome P450 116 [Aurantimicrobium photophilum]MDF9810558.1 cytochrome P450 [Aurantimicrobium minutum]MDH6255813.1 cytochrome P450 [Aurantimicrobium minutum]